MGKVEQDLVASYNSDENLINKTLQIWETKKQRKALGKLYPGLSDSGLDIAMRIRDGSREFLKEGGFDTDKITTSSATDLGLNAGFYTVADNRINEEGQAMLYLFKDLEGVYSPETADTSKYYVDPEMFEGLKIGDKIKGFSMFNVMHYGYKLRNEDLRK
jgi:hypothetical protein